eukprot:Opistho-2@73428
MTHMNFCVDYKWRPARGLCRVPSHLGRVGCSLPHLDDACIDELLNALGDNGVLEVILCGGRALLHLLKDLPHDGVLHNFLDLGVMHRTLGALLRGFASLLNGLEAPEAALLGLFVAGLNAQRCLVSLEGLVVLLKKELNRTAASVALHKLGVAFEALLAVLEAERVFHQLRVARGAVAIHTRILGIPLDGLRVVLDGAHKIALLKELVALLTLLCGLFGIDVVLQPLLLQLLLKLLNTLENFGCAMLRKALAEVGEGLVQLVLLQIGIPHARIRLCNVSVVGLVLAPNLNGLLAVSNAFGVVTSLEKHRCPVRVECHVSRIECNRRIVVLDGLLKRLAFVCVVSEIFLLQSLLLQLVFLRQWARSLLRLAAGFLLLCLLFSLLLALCLTLLLRTLPLAIDIHWVVCGLRVNAHQSTNHCEHAAVLEMHSKLLRVALQLVDKVHKVFLGEKFCGRWIRREFCKHIALEHVSKQSIRPGPRILAEHALCIFKASLQLRILRLDLESPLVGLGGVLIPPKEGKGSALARVSLGPVGLQAHSLVRIIESIFILLQ